MLPHRRDPYLWIHLAGLATVPFWLDVCLVGLAVEEPVVPSWLELATLALVGTLPIVWMQLQRPFYIFSVPGLALRPDKLADERRRLLTLQRGWLSRGLVLFAAIALWCALYWLYQIAPVAADLPWLMGKSRATGWGICAIAFFCANLFTLVPATVVSLFLASPRRLEQVSPFEVADILPKFTVLGLRVGQILPEALSTAVPLEKTAATEPATDRPPSAQVGSADAAITTDNIEVGADNPIPSEISSHRPNQGTALDTAEEGASWATELNPELDGDAEQVVGLVEPPTAATPHESDPPSPLPESVPPVSVAESDTSLEVAPVGTPSEAMPPQASSDEVPIVTETPFSSSAEAEPEELENVEMPPLFPEKSEEASPSGIVASHDLLTNVLPAHSADVPKSITSLDEVIVDQLEEAKPQPSSETNTARSDDVSTPKVTQSDVR